MLEDDSKKRFVSYPIITKTVAANRVSGRASSVSCSEYYSRSQTWLMDSRDNFETKTKTSGGQQVAFFIQPREVGEEFFASSSDSAWTACRHW